MLQISCVPIYRDKEWFKNAYIILKKFWDDVLYYREKGIDQLYKDIADKKKKDKGDEIFIDTSMLNFVNVSIPEEKEEECLFENIPLKLDKPVVKVISVKNEECLFSNIPTTKKKSSKKKFAKKKIQDECLFSNVNVKKRKINKDTSDEQIRKHINNLCLFEI